ncbi:MAG: Zn-ribbon domain-containing OB-fold protein [Thermoproteota archaeon]|jgi:uncharacterized OB-fold protein
MSAPSYWREKKYRYRLIAKYCKKCDKKYYPPRLVCLGCGNNELEDVELPKKGTLITYTWVTQPPKEFADNAPYAIGLIKLDDGTIIFAQLTDVDYEELREGLRVEAVFRKMFEEDDKGLIYYGIKFRPAYFESNVV